MTIEIHTDLKKFSEGKANKSTYGYYLFFIFLIFFSISFYAQRQYPSKFALFYTHISSQGSYVKNPDGALIWNIGMIIIGILYVPLFMYYYRCYSQNFPKYAHRGLVAGLCGSLSYIFVGLFPEEYDIFHEIPSTIAFFGHIFSAYFYYPALRTKLKQKLGIIRIYFIIITLTTFIAITINTLNYSDILVNPALLIFPFWEWLLFIEIYGWIWIMWKES